MKQEDLNLGFLETQFGSIKENDYCAIRSDSLIEVGRFESQNAVYWNKLGSKNDVLSDISVECDHSKSEAEIFFHGDAKLDNTLGELTHQDNLIGARSNFGLELESGTNLFIDSEKFTEDGLDIISGELCEEWKGLKLEENNPTDGAYFNELGTNNSNLLGIDKLEIEGVYLDNSIEDVEFISSNNFAEYNIGEVTNTPFSNEPEPVVLSTPYLTQQDVFPNGDTAIPDVISKANQTDLLQNEVKLGPNIYECCGEIQDIEPSFLNLNDESFNSEIFPFEDLNSENIDYLISESVNEAMEQFGVTFNLDHSEIKIDSFIKSYKSNISGNFNTLQTNVVVVNLINIEGDFSQNDVVVNYHGKS